MKILVADKISPTGVEFLKAQEGFDVIEAYGSSPEKILEIASSGVDAIIVRSETQVTDEVMEAAKSLKAVGRAGVGVDNIDIDAATKRGVVVMNTPSGNTIATAELTFTHMLCGARPVPQANATMQAGGWDRKKFSGSELNGKTLGVLGLGRIGSEVTKRAQAFGMKVLGYDPYLTEARAKTLGVENVELADLFKQADYITVHMPLTDSTKNMINAESIATMKDGVRIFNCARGGIINQDDLVDALKSGKVAAAGLDVYDSEPLADDSPLRGIPNLVLTPHLGASTKEAQESVGIEIAEAIAKVLQTGEVQNAINMPSVDAHTLAKLKPYITLGKQLGLLLQQITPDKIEKLSITYWGKIIDLDAMPLTRAIQLGYMKRIAGEEVNDVNAPQMLKALGVEVGVTKSNSDASFTELVEVAAICPDGKHYSVAGTLIGTAQTPRIVSINKHDVEVSAQGILLVIRNRDVPGIVGKLGMALAKEKVNIANMSLSRHSGADHALAIYEVDSEPSESLMNELTSDADFESVCVARL